MGSSMFDIQLTDANRHADTLRDFFEACLDEERARIRGQRFGTVA